MTAAGIATVTRGGHQGAYLAERMTKLDGSASPFLESGFMFEGNPDIIVSMPDGSGLRRFNMVSIHLAGGHVNFPGLSEMGTADWDQQYMTTGDYMRQFYAKEPSIGELEAAEKYGMLTTRESTQAVDMQMLDPEGTREWVIREGQKNLIANVK